MQRLGLSFECDDLPSVARNYKRPIPTGIAHSSSFRAAPETTADEVQDDAWAGSVGAVPCGTTSSGSSSRMAVPFPGWLLMSKLNSWP